MKNNIHKTFINTEIINDSCISQEVVNQTNEIVTNKYKMIIDTQDKEIRKALIELGWTPPKVYNYIVNVDYLNNNEG